MNTISIRKPYDMHVHFRQGPAMEYIVPQTARCSAYALVMPNTVPGDGLDGPIKTGHDAAAYRDMITPYAGGMTPLMTIKILPTTDKFTIYSAKAAGVVAAKIYPEGVTTNSHDGIGADCFLNPPEEFLGVLQTMENLDMVLCLHGEFPGVFCMDRESEFLFFVEQTHKSFPKLKIVLEHITTRDAVGLIHRINSPNVAATITAHHLAITLDDVIGDKLNPHNFCKPIAKTPRDRHYLRTAAMGHEKNLINSSRFFLGTDSAPHHVNAKHCAECCAGCFTAPVFLELLAEIFEQEDRLDQLEAFTSTRAADFYGLPKVADKITLEKSDWLVPHQIHDVVPFYARRRLAWRIT